MKLVPPVSSLSSVEYKQKGVVLVAVLWIVVLLMVVTSGVVSQYRTQQRLVGNIVVRAQAEAAAAGGVYYLIHILNGNISSGNKVLPDATYRIQLGDMEVVGKILDERGKVDLNASPGELIRGVMLGAGLSLELSDALTDTILDWRDNDHLRRLHGAEDADYRRAGFSHEVKDAPFDTVDELRQVMGMTPEIFARVREGFTVHTGKADINPQYAPLVVLRAIPGMTAVLASTYLRARHARLAEGLPLPPFPLTDSPYVTVDNGPAYTLAIEVRIDDRTVSRVKAVVVPEQGVSAGFRVASWHTY